MTSRELYQAKQRSVEDCLALISSGDALCFGKDGNEPRVLGRQLHTIADRVENVTLLKGRASDYDFLRDERVCGHIETQSAFFSPGWEQAQRLGLATFIACDLYDQPAYYNAAYPRNVYIAAVTPMDEDGNFQVGLSLMWEQDIHPLSCEKIILEENKQLQRVKGGLDINIRDVTAFYSVDEPIPEIRDLVPSPEEALVGRYVAELVPDGATIQLGIGTLPNACAAGMMDKRDLGVHTEMFTNLMAGMVEAGVITGARKSINPGEHTFCFAGGSRHMFELLHDDPRCVIRPSSYVTDPRVIMQNDNMISINAILEIDLTGQVCSESIGVRQYSGPGGAFDFAYGAQHAKGGRSILITTARTKKGLPKIKPILTLGAQVTIPRPYADTVVTEYGVATLKGRTLKDRVNALIAIAHPDDRPWLRAEAKKNCFIV